MKLFLSSFHPIDEHVLEEYISHWSEYVAPKKTIITECGKTERYLYFVAEGIQKAYYLNEGKQHVMFFSYAPSFSGIMNSFLAQTPSKYYLESITDSKFLRIPYAKHAQLIKDYRDIETLLRKVTELLFIGMIERHHELLAFNVEKRFREFVKRSPHLLNMVSQKDISSYLRIDPTNFSKLMNSIEY